MAHEKQVLPDFDSNLPPESDDTFGNIHSTSENENISDQIPHSDRLVDTSDIAESHSENVGNSIRLSD